MINGPPSLKSYGATRRWHHAPSVLQPVSCILSVGRFLGAFHPGFNHQAQSISKKSLDLQFCTQNGMLKTKKCPFLKLYLQIFRHLAWPTPDLFRCDILAIMVGIFLIAGS
jgi:hypothetical protein